MALIIFVIAIAAGIAALIGGLGLKVSFIIFCVIALFAGCEQHDQEEWEAHCNRTEYWRNGGPDRRR